MEDNSKLKEQIKLKIAISKINEEEKDIAMEKKKKIMLTRSIAAASVCLILTTGVVLADDIQKIYENFISQKNKISNTAYYELDYRFYEDMQFEHGIYYKKINTFEEYKKYKDMWPDLLDMSEEDFINNFMIITAAENPESINLDISEIYTNDENMYIEFGKTDSNYDSNVIIGTKLSRDLDRENIKIRYKKDLAIVDGSYTKITDIPSDYSPEQAIEDGCLVLNTSGIISNNKEIIGEFIENCKNGVECNIRIYNLIDKEIWITDVQFTDNKYKVNRLMLPDITDLYSEEYTLFKDEIFNWGVSGKTKYIEISLANDDAEYVHWIPFLICPYE